MHACECWNFSKKNSESTVTVGGAAGTVVGALQLSLTQIMLPTTYSSVICMFECSDVSARVCFVAAAAVPSGLRPQRKGRAHAQNQQRDFTATQHINNAHR